LATESAAQVLHKLETQEPWL